MNGLCGPLPAMDPLAAVYAPDPLGGPMIPQDDIGHEALLFVRSFKRTSVVDDVNVQAAVVLFPPDVATPPEATLTNGSVWVPL